MKPWKRDAINFDDFEEIGYNAEWDTYGVHGSNVYHDGHFIGEIPWKSPQDLNDLTDEELQEVFAEYGIII